MDKMGRGANFIRAMLQIKGNINGHLGIDNPIQKINLHNKIFKNFDW